MPPHALCGPLARRSTLKPSRVPPVLSTHACSHPQAQGKPDTPLCAPPQGEAWITSSSPSSPHHAPSHKPSLTQAAIKQCACWQQLHSLALSTQPRNHIHVTALATRLAALMPSHDALSSSSNSSSGSSNGVRMKQRGSSMSVSNAESKLHSLVGHTFTLVQAHVSTLDARGIANATWALARTTRALRQLHGQPADGPLQDSSSAGSAGSMSKPGHVSKAAELEARAAAVALALLQRAGNSGWGMGFNAQVRGTVVVQWAGLRFRLLAIHSGRDRGQH